MKKLFMRVGGTIGISRALGFIRDALTAKYLGAGTLSDIFYVAWKIPNTFRSLFGEGAFQSAFVPMMTEKQGKSRAAAVKFGAETWGAITAALLVFVVALEILMPVLIWITAPGFGGENFARAVHFARIIFPYLILITTMNFFSGILNSLGKFSLPAMMPALFNLCLIAALLGFGTRAPISALSIAILCAGFIQCIILFFAIRHFGFRLCVVRPRLSPDIKKLFHRMGLGFMNAGAYHINIMVGTIIASFEIGAVSWLNYADRINQLPYAIVGIATGSILLASLSGAIGKKDLAAVFTQQNSALRHIFFFLIPSTVAIIVAGEPMIAALFQRGAFDANATHNTAVALRLLCLSAIPMAVAQVYGATMFAAQYVKAANKIYMFSFIVGMIISVATAPFLGYIGFVIGTICGAITRAAGLACACKSHGLFSISHSTKVRVIRATVCAGIMGAGLYFGAPFATGAFGFIGLCACAGLFYIAVMGILSKSRS